MPDMGSRESEIRERDANVRRVRRITALIGALAAGVTGGFGVLAAAGTSHVGHTTAGTTTATTTAVTATSSRDDSAAETETETTPAATTEAPTATQQAPVAVSGGS
jgi:hypothetical protein